MGLWGGDRSFVWGEVSDFVQLVVDRDWRRAWWGRESSTSIGQSTLWFGSRGSSGLLSVSSASSGLFRIPTLFVSCDVFFNMRGSFLWLFVEAANSNDLVNQGDNLWFFISSMVLVIVSLSSSSFGELVVLGFHLGFFNFFLNIVLFWSHTFSLFCLLSLFVCFFLGLIGLWAIDDSLCFFPLDLVNK